MTILGPSCNQKMEGKKVHVKLEGMVADVMLKIDRSKYEKYVVHEYGKPVIYIILTKALYGTIQAALLFWKNLTAQLEEWAFKINPYNFCIANKIINGKQCTIEWHVNDLKRSHEDPKVVTNILGLIDRRYRQEIIGGKRAPLTISHGKINDYLGMTLDFPEDGVIKIDMKDYIAKNLAEMPYEMNRTATTPTAAHLF